MTEQVLTRAGGRVKVVVSLPQGRTAAVQCGFFTHKSVPVIFEPPCITFIVMFLSIGKLFKCPILEVSASG